MLRFNTLLPISASTILSTLIDFSEAQHGTGWASSRPSRVPRPSRTPEEQEQARLAMLALSIVFGGGIAIMAASYVVFHCLRQHGFFQSAAPNRYQPILPVSSLNHDGQVPDNQAENDKNIPKEFICPISLQVMKHAVLAADGQTYEKESLRTWLIKSLTSPITRVPLSMADTRDNKPIQNLIDKFQSKKTVNAENAFGLLQDDIQNECICPISKKIMRIPVLASDGGTYDEDSLKDCFAKNGRVTSSITNKEIDVKTVVKNYALQDLLERYQAAREEKGSSLVLNV